MADAFLTPEEILSTAEDVLRRYGPAKATVVDVARALGVSHGSVYRHFTSRKQLFLPDRPQDLTEIVDIAK